MRMSNTESHDSSVDQSVKPKIDTTVLTNDLIDKVVSPNHGLKRG